ncbi:MAG: hypothetical protein M3Y57_04360, partial [Acidobacteriota bacterium]|nr:hypothetical protein [Acidobacteriota bacterium]
LRRVTNASSWAFDWIVRSGWEQRRRVSNDSKQKCVSCGLRVRAEPVFNCGMPGGATCSAGVMDPTAHPQMLLLRWHSAAGRENALRKLGVHPRLLQTVHTG